MRPLAELPDEEARAIGIVLFDLDDTVLTHGRLTREAYGAICDLADAGLDLVAVTGRPAGWGEIIARQWPVLAVVAENGAAILRREHGGVARLVQDPTAKVRLAPLVSAVLGAFPDVELADDNAARLTDVAFDIGERRKLPRERVEALRAFVLGQGARATMSSVHLHASFEGDDKASGALRVLLLLRRLDAGAARARAVFVGDSENDAACFACFRTTVGVANVAPWVGRLTVPPRYVTEAPMGAGFAQLARRLLSARSGAGTAEAVRT
ncbi:MAG: HAD hydrolase family protein [Deltaproteobacteria bacterium]|nr:HAD hydrolase family protein [Deltaproteobacteria bacterium]